MEGSTAPVFLAGTQLGEARHVCAFFNSCEDEYRVTLPFIKDGFECGDKALHIIDPARRANHLGRMASYGINVPSAQQSGQLEVRDWADIFFRDPVINIDQQLTLLEEALTRNKQEGFPVTRYVAHAEWAFEEGASVDLLLEFEARVNHIWPRSADTVICTYDLARFGADAVVDAMRTHPVIIIAGILQQNPFFEPPDEFLREFRRRRAARNSSSEVA
jgi:hypothetical protein